MEEEEEMEGESDGVDQEGLRLLQPASHLCSASGRPLLSVTVCPALSQRPRGGGCGDVQHVCPSV